jgi:multidrug efflux pump subunit AcrA (membrane-fusion protein)
MNRRKVVVHTGMSVLLIAAGVEASRAAATATPTPSPTPTPSGHPTGPAARTITATANLNAPRTVGVTFSGSPRIVTAVPVKIGDHVRRGQALAAVDDRAARHELEQAEAGVAAAKGDLLDALSSVRSTRAAVAQARQALCNAQLAVHQAKQTLRLDAATQADAVHAAELKLAAARRDVTRTASAAKTATRITARPVTSPPSPSTTNDVRVGTRNRNITASTSRSSVATALSDLSSAERTRATTLLADQQQIKTLIGQARLAARDLDAAAAGVPSDPSGTHFGPIERARAGLRQAKVEVRRAKADLADTVLRAPFEGTVVDIAGAVGESPAAAARGSVATSANPAGNGVVENRNAATATGFVVLADLTHRAVTAHVDEEHIVQVKVGQPAVVTFPATGTVVSGTVSAIALQETVAEHVVYYNVDIDLDDRAATQKLGQTASVVITTAGAQPAPLVVPNAAYSRVGGKTIVSVLRQGRVLKLPVTLGVIGTRDSQISSPLLRPDDLVVVPVTGNRQGRL